MKLYANKFLITGILFWSIFSLPTKVTAAAELSLDDCLELALKNNPVVKIAAAEQDAASWRLKEAKAGRLPSLNYLHTASRLKPDPSKTQFTAETDNFDNRLSLSLPLYTGGRLSNQIEQAELSLKLAELALSKTKHQTRLDTTMAYFNLLQANNLRKLNQESVERLAAHLKNVRANYQAGTVAKTDVLRSEVELANAEQNLIKAKNNYDLAMVQLNNLMGLPLTNPLVIAENLHYEKCGLSLDECVRFALENRPEIIQADCNLVIAEKNIAVARSNQLPSLVFNANQDWNDQYFPGDKNDNWSLNLVISWNLIDSGHTKSRVGQAESLVTKGIEQAEQIRDLIQLEVWQSYLNMNEAEKRIATNQVAVTKALEDYKIARVRYTTGIGTNLDIIDSQMALTQAQTNFIQALYDFNSGKAKLEKAIGLGRLPE